MYSNVYKHMYIFIYIPTHISIGNCICGVDSLPLGCMVYGLVGCGVIPLRVQINQWLLFVVWGFGFQIQDMWFWAQSKVDD